MGILPRWFFREIAGNFAIEAYDLPIEISQQYCCMTWHVKNRTDAGHVWLRENLMAAFRDRVGEVGTRATA